MDWTGGTKRRFTPGKSNTTLQKQKAHFAKVRAAKLAVNSSSNAFMPDYLPSGLFGGGVSDQSVERPKVQPRGAPEMGHTPNRTTLKCQGNIYRHLPRASDAPKRNFSMIDSNDRQVSAARCPSSPTCATYGHPIQGEYLLPDRRQRLLARADWLSLAAARPVRMGLRPQQEQERIGKRRKIERTGARRGQPAGQRRVTPLMEERLESFDYTMSGALPAEEMHFKIGTDALATQSQISFPHDPYEHGHARHTSTGFCSLSEESMLLGDDGDVFEAGPTSGISPSRKDPSLDQVSLAAHAERHVPSEEGYEPDLWHPGSRHTNLVSGSLPPPPFSRDCSAQSRGDAASARSHELPGCSSPQDLGNGVAPDMVPQDILQPNFRCQIDAHDDAERPLTRAPYENFWPNAKASDEDEWWRRLMDIHSHNTADHSMRAVKSSSQHTSTVSESRIRSRMEPVMSDELDHDQSISTPAPPNHKIDVATGTLPTAAGSTSTSLRRISQIAKHVGSTHEEEGEALWRKFIVGSPESSRSSWSPASPRNSPGELVAETARNLTDELFEVSGLGTSDAATAGDTHCGAIPGSSAQQMSNSSRVPRRKVRPAHDLVNSIGSSRD